jgi:hypothetical protein
LRSLFQRLPEEDEMLLAQLRRPSASRSIHQSRPSLQDKALAPGPHAMSSCPKQPRYRHRLSIRYEQKRMCQVTHAWIRIGAHQMAQRLPLLCQLGRHAALLPAASVPLYRFLGPQ